MALLGGPLGVAPHVTIDGAASPGGLVFLNGDSDAVRALAFLDWQPAPPAAAGQPPTMATSQGLLGVALLPAMSPDTTPAANASRALPPPMFGLTAAGWQQILDEYHASGVFSRRFTTLSSFEAAVTTTRFQNPPALVFNDAMLHLGQPLAIPAAGGNAQAVRRRELLINVHYLSLVRCESLCQPREALPLLQYARVLSIIGACRTMASRTDEGAAVQILTDLFRQKFPEYHTDRLLAQVLPDLVEQARLPADLCSRTLSFDNLLRDAMDGLSYMSGGTRRSNVERKRIYLLSDSVRRRAPIRAPRAWRITIYPLLTFPFTLLF